MLAQAMKKGDGWGPRCRISHQGRGTCRSRAARAECADAGFHGSSEQRLADAVKLSVARCASTSYKTVEGFDMTLDRAIALHDKLVASVPLHASPCEHQCYADPMNRNNWGRDMGWERPELHGNLTGFVQYRKTLKGECQ